MAHFALLWKARTIEKYRQNYENEKVNSIIMSKSDIPETTLFQRWRHYRHDMRKRLSRTFSKWYPAGTTVSNFFVSLQTDMGFASILLRSLYGFVGGLLLTYLGFMFFVFQLSLSLMHATVLSSVMGMILTLGLTFSNRIRCLIFLLVPQLFSRVGRYTLTCYALVLILTGPATNTLKNSEVLSESMACSQEQIKLNVRQINESMKKPLNSIKASLKITIEGMQMVVRKLKMALIRINRLILSIASVVQSGYYWLGSVVKECNEALGTPYEKCLNALKENFQRCEENLELNHVKRTGAKKSDKDYIRNLLEIIAMKDFRTLKDKENVDVIDFEAETREKLDVQCGQKSKDKNTKPWFHNTVNVAKIACASLKSYGKFCDAADFAKETFLATIKRKLKTFTQHISALLHVRVNVHHTYTFIGNSSSTNQIAAGIVTEIRNRADPIITWLSWSSCVTSLFLLLIIFRAKHYQHMFETRSRFDNRYITKEFRELDLKRLREGRGTVLPLNKRERIKYVTTTSFRLVASEKVHLNRSALFMTVTTLKLLIHIVADYSLYWVLMTIRHHGQLQSPMQPGLADAGAFITGTGFVARLLQSFIDTLNIQLTFPPPDMSCLPNPHPPDFKRYCQIGFLIFLLWFFALFEPYGLRLRHLIMGHYRPERAKARAVWLYNHILRTRASFMKFARRRLHREHKYSSESKLTFHRLLRSLIPYCWLKYLLGIKPEEPHCLLCNITEDASDCHKELIKCEVHYCPGIYCTSCFSDIGQLCTVCLSPSDYGDLSDVSLEKGSSDEDNNDDDDDDRDKSHDPGNPNGCNKRTTNDDADAFSDEYEGTPEGSRISKQNRVLSHANNKNKGFAKSPLIQRSTELTIAKIVVKNKIKIVHLHALERKSNNRCDYDFLFERFTPQNASKKGYKGSCVYSFENLVIFKDQNNNNVLARKKRYSFQYSVYKITKFPFEIKKTDSVTQLAKFLRKRKLIRRKKKETKMNPLYFKYLMTCSQTNLNKITEKITQVKDNIDQGKVSNNLKSSRNETNGNSPEFKGMNHKNQDCGENKSRKDTHKLNNKRSKNVNKFHMTFAKYWKNVKLSVLPHRGITNTKRDLPPIKEKKHTRKKKRRNKKTHTKSCHKLKLKKKEHNKNSRIFAYLDEQDWINNSLNTAEKININNERNLKDLYKQKDEDMVVNNIMIPRLNLDESSESIIVLPKYSPFAMFDNTNKRVDFAKSALDRFFKSIVGKSDEIVESKSVKNNFGETDLKFDGENVSCSIQNKEHLSYLDSYNCKNPSKYNNNFQENNLGGFRLKRIFSESLSVSKLSKSYSRIKSVCSSLLVRNVGNQSIDVKYKEKSKNKNIENPALIKNQKRTQNKYENQMEFNTGNLNQSPAGIEQRRYANVKERNDENKEERCVKNKNIKGSIIIKEKEKQPKCNDGKQQIRPTIQEIVEDDQCFKTKYRPRTTSLNQTELRGNKNEKGIQTMSALAQMNDKGITVMPLTNSCGCNCKVGTQDCAVQARCTGYKRRHNHVEVSTGHPACTCAAQYHPSSKDACTYFAGPSSSDSTKDSLSSISSEELKTDSTTVCSVSNRHYYSNRFGRLKVKVTTKTNQSTLTDKTHRCNVSTSTYDDWWSPIVDRKYNPRKEDNFLERKRRDHNLMRERKIFKNRGMSTRDKFVTFRSKTQVIPNTEFDYTDVLSPSRYLLESQRYYNELFCKLPLLYPVANIQKHQILEKEYSQISSRHRRRRGRNSKKSEESYTSRKQKSPRKRGLEFVRYVAKK